MLMRRELKLASDKQRQEEGGGRRGGPELNGEAENGAARAN